MPSRAIATDYAVAGVLLHIYEISETNSTLHNFTVEGLSDALTSRLNDGFDKNRTLKFVRIIESIGIGKFFDDPFADPIFQISDNAIRNFFQNRRSVDDVFGRSWNLGLDWLRTAFQRDTFWQAVDAEPLTLGVLILPDGDEDGPVGVDHNSKAFTEASKLLDELLASLRKSNDVGGISEAELKELVPEVEGLKSEFESGVVQMPTFAMKARGVMGWIASKAAEAVVGALALTTLAALLKVFEIPF